jgi:hypothetical protein
MYAYKNSRSGLAFLSFITLGLVFALYSIFNLTSLSPKAYAANNSVAYCSKIISEQDGGTAAQVQQPNNPAYKHFKACLDAYTTTYNAYKAAAANAQATFDGICKTTDVNYSYCTQGRNQGKTDGQGDHNTTTSGNPGTTTDTDILNKAKADSACQAGSEAIKGACYAGYITAYKGGSESSVCKNGGSVKVGSTTYSVTTRTIGNCSNGFDAGNREDQAATPTQPQQAEASTAAKNACVDYGPTGTKPNHSEALFNACTTGYDAATHGKSESEACTGYADPSDSRNACLAGYNAQSGDAGDDTSECVANSHTSLEWIMCPLITAISDGTEKLNDFIENQLNFDVNNFLPDTGNEVGAYKAWAVIKDISTSILVVVLLVMVFSQAAGTGVFEAYTVRKVLPRLIIAVIAMQLSWELTRFVIGLVNNLGEGIAQLMAAPFGGRGNLDLGSLLNNLGGLAAGVTSVTLTAALVSGIFLGTVFLPGALMIVLSLFISVIVGLASVLFRNVIIIFCVIFVPVALIMWVIPNQSTKKYWSLWSDNFSKALLLFPIMIGVIYAGRIFAYIAGGAANVGFLNLIMILVGFFAPYAIIMKGWKWGGSALSQGHNAISSNGVMKKARELNKKELGGMQQRRINERAKALNPSHPDYARVTRRGPLGIPTRWEGKLGQTAFQNLRAGRVLPTKRNLAVTLKRGDTWSSDEDAIADALLKREQDKATTQGARAYFLKTDEDGNYVKDANGEYVVDSKVQSSTAGGKAAIFAAMGSTDARRAGMAVDRAIETQSSVELANNLVPIASRDLAVDGAQIFNDADGNMFVRGYDTKRWAGKINATPKLFGWTTGKMPISMPFITERSPGKAEDTRAELQKEENDRAWKEGRDPEQIPALTPHQERAIQVMRGYTNADSVGGQAESMFSEYARLAQENPVVAKEFTRVLDRFVVGGEKGELALGSLSSSSDIQKVMNKILQEAAPPGAAPATIQDYLDKAKSINHGNQQQSQAGNQQTGNQQQGTQQQGGQQQNQQQGGELIIPHKPGEIISPGGVIAPQERRTRPPEPPTQP